jgi:chemotaxis protein methyltransferase CheR
MEASEFALSDSEFDRVRQRLYKAAGISLSDAKRTLVIARLSKLVRNLRLASFDAYLRFLDEGATAAQAQEFVNALTTNLTRFWREDHHFSHLVDYVGQILARRRSGEQRLRIWSAGCSSGQEPYTVAMTLLDAYPELKRWDFRILATDIDTAVLAKGAAGLYPESELNGLTAERARLLERLPDGRVAVPQACRSVIAFKPLNLMGPWPMRGPFDAIFCRNVAIYFDKPTQRELFRRLGDILVPGGFLYIGHSENLDTSAGSFRLVGKTIYQAKAAARARSAA